MKILLVDNEPLIINGIEKILRNHFQDTYDIRKTVSSVQALSIFEEQKPDLIITDVQIPVLNGIEMVQKLKNKRANLKTIFISCYDSFHYAKEAILLGSDNYLLKPINSVELIDTIQQINTKLVKEQTIEKFKSDSEQNTLRDHFLRKFFQNKILTSELQQWDKLMIPIIKWSKYSIANIHGELSDQNRLGQIKNFINDHVEENCSFVVGPSNLMVLFNPDIKQNYNSDFKHLSRHFQLSIVLGPESESLQQMITSYHLTEVFQQFQHLYCSTDVIDLSKEGALMEEIIASKQFFTSIAQSLNNQNIAQCKNSILYIINKWKMRSKTKLLLDYLSLIICQASSDFFDPQQINLDPMFKSFKYIAQKSATELENKIFTNLEWIEKEIFQNVSQYSPIIQRVLEIVKENITTHYSLKMLANLFNMNPAYLGQLFQKEVGSTYSQFCQNYRMQLANIMIREGKKRICHIAKEIGYEDISHFYRHYKKKYGVTPNKARIPRC